MNIGILMVSISLTVFSLVDSRSRIHPDVHLSIVEISHKYGYAVEEHEVVTEDGYILTIFRIPHRKNDLTANRKPFLLMHGLFGQAENFIVNKRNNGSLAYFLADNGYDVWLGNNRGTQHGLRHKVLDYRKKPFWQFSLHELGIFDLPAIVDYVLTVTKLERLFYIGHSQGGSIYFIMTSLKPKFQEKITLALLLAPAGMQSHFQNPILQPLVHEYKQLKELANNLNIFSLPPPELRMKDMVDICAIPLQNICLTTYLIFSSQIESSEFDSTMLPVMLQFIPSVSILQLLHFAEIIYTGHFQPLDYGDQKNMEVYGKNVPEDYPIKNIRVPTAFFYSNTDKLVFVKDVEYMCNIIQNCVFKHNLTKHKWSHYDIVFGTHIAEDLFGAFMEITKKYDVD